MQLERMSEDKLHQEWTRIQRNYQDAEEEVGRLQKDFMTYEDELYQQERETNQLAGEYVDDYELQELLDEHKLLLKKATYENEECKRLLQKEKLRLGKEQEDKLQDIRQQLSEWEGSVL